MRPPRWLLRLLDRRMRKHVPPPPAEPTSPPSRPLLTGAEAMINAGNEAMERGDYDLAVRHFKRAQVIINQLKAANDQ